MAIQITLDSKAKHKPTQKQKEMFDAFLEWLDDQGT